MPLRVDLPSWPTTNFTTTDVTIAAGMTELQPAATDTLSGTVDATRFGISGFERVYELETPANTSFAFNVIARGEGNWGFTRICVGHVTSGGVVPAMGVESIAAAGMALDAPGMVNAGRTADVTGDGFARVTVRGSIATEQVLVFQIPVSGPDIDIGIRIKIGASSDINLSGGNPQGFRAGMTTTGVYSSDSCQFGLPAIAVSGDRYTMATYDGDPNQQQSATRRRNWLQLDSTAGTVTGGAAEAHSNDAGFWRDQEVAAMGNVLGVAYTGAGQVRAEISLDRGASFPIVRDIDPSAGMGTRLVQIAIAADYSIGVLYWRNVNAGMSTYSTLMLQEATPSGFDSNNTPTGYFWAAPTTVHNAGLDVTPLLMHMEYSQGGDLVVGYGYTTMFWSGGTWTNTSTSYFRCAVRQWGSSGFYDVEVDREDFVVPMDPHVCLLGSGSGLEIFYTYEKADGVYLCYSNNAGATFTQACHMGIAGAMQPSVHARMQSGQKRVDLLFVSPDGWGLELHNLTWDNFNPGATPAHSRITQSAAVSGGLPPAGMQAGLLISTLAWMGYDSCLSGDDVAICIHEYTYDSYNYYWAAGTPTQPAGGSGGGAAPPPPTILLPGLTGTVPLPDPAHCNQLRVVIID